MRLKFGLKSEYNAFTVVIVLNLKQRTVGLVVDAVSDVLALHGTQIRPVPQFSTTTDTGFITGIGSAPSDDQDRMLILVDVERLVSSADDRLPDTEGMDLIGL
jgi:purine-binding chemotaxis protein CheW